MVQLLDSWTQPELPKKIGKYHVTRRLGRGSKGAVYGALDDLGRQVAIKVFTEDFFKQPGVTDRFVAEVRSAVAALGFHPNLRTVCDVGNDGGNPYVVMEVGAIEGKPLGWIIRHEQLSLMDKLGIIVQVCAALIHARQRGIPHVDFNASPVAVLPGNHVKVLDFCVDRALRSCGAPRGLIGFNPYWSPESYKSGDGLPVDARSDVFSIGVSLYYLLTGKYPFGRPNPEAFHVWLHEPHAPLSASLTSYPTALDTIVDRALAKNPDDRYATAEEFADDLRLVITELEKDPLRG